ncbi:hypothetical protein Ancab_011149 [Ancistrocladus abbreviatus]
MCKWLVILEFSTGNTSGIASCSFPHLLFLLLCADASPKMVRTEIRTCAGSWSCSFPVEQIPGKPKDGNKPRRMALEYPPLAPKLPPGKILNHIKKPSDKVLKDSGATKPQSEYDLPSSPDVSSLDENVMELEESGDEMEKENSST